MASETQTQEDRMTVEVRSARRLFLPDGNLEVLTRVGNILLIDGKKELIVGSSDNNNPYGLPAFALAKRGPIDIIGISEYYKHPHSQNEFYERTRRGVIGRGEAYEGALFLIDFKTCDQMLMEAGL